MCSPVGDQGPTDIICAVIGDIDQFAAIGIHEIEFPITFFFTDALSKHNFRRVGCFGKKTGQTVAHNMTTLSVYKTNRRFSRIINP